MERPVSVAASIGRHVHLFRETVVPWQATAGLAWLFSGMFSGTGPVRLLTDWTAIPLVVAVVSAYFSGMCWNRLIDWRIDARNPRTCRRPVPCGKLRPEELAFYALFTLFVFLASCSYLPLAASWIGMGISTMVLLYSFIKRITYGRHFVLGVLYAALPLVGSLWQSGTVSLSTLFLSLSAFSAISGVDILYSLQDEVFDKRYGLCSIPAKFGAQSALEISACLHAVALIAGTFAMAKAGVPTFGFVVWGCAAVAFFYIWRSLWIYSEKSVYRSFAYLYILFPVASFVSLFTNGL